MSSARDIGQRLKQAREAVGLTQVAAAERLGISQGSLAGYEQGSRQPPEDFLASAAVLYESHPALLRYGEDILRLAGGKLLADQMRAAANILIELAGMVEYSATVEVPAPAGQAAQATPTATREGMDAVGRRYRAERGQSGRAPKKKGAR